MPANRHHHVLIVDDNKAIGGLLSEAIAEYGYRAIAVCDGAAMRKKLDDEPIDIVLLDIHMPNEDSRMLASQILERQLPLIMMSGDRSGIAFVAELKLPLLTKPFRIPELVRLLAATLDGQAVATK